MHDLNVVKKKKTKTTRWMNLKLVKPGQDGENLQADWL